MKYSDENYGTGGDVMNVLHYALGFSPFRTGGLTKYVMDLSHEELKLGHNVAMLWPGRMGFINKKVSIIAHASHNGIKSFELVNPLPVSLMNGIQDVDAYTKWIDEKVYMDFINKFKPDIIHVHSFMGLHAEFLKVAKMLGIKIVYTTHDYFGICPKVNLLYNGKPCKNTDGENCLNCNQSAFSLNKVRLMQSVSYRRLKYSKLIKMIRNRGKIKNNKSEVNNIIGSKGKTTIKDYKNLKKYYNDMFNMVDFFLFNSANTKKVYEDQIKELVGKVISISHNGIQDKRKIFKNKNKKENLNILFLGGTEPYKGYLFLKRTLDKLYDSGYKNFNLQIFAPTEFLSSYIIQHDAYTFDQLDEVYESADLVIVPSLWNETFGFVTLEALSYGVPVIVSDLVGAKDLIIDSKNGFIFKPHTNELEQILSRILNDTTILNTLNENIIEMDLPDFTSHTIKIIEIYNQLAV
jgi:glycosyltransferase involved in cell wall biosynthesis